MRTLQSPVGAEVVIDGARYINFGGSSYLGLGSLPNVIEAGISSLRAYGGGYQFPRELHVVPVPYQEAESAAADFFGLPAALYLPGGYSVGLVTLAALRSQYTRIFFDELAHFSLREAIAASALPAHPFRHLDAQDLSKQLRQNAGPREKILVVTDGMYSTFGEIAPLDELLEVAMPYEARLVVDESHSFGVLGEYGRGAWEYHHLPPESVLFGGSTAKALGAAGGMVLGDQAELERLRTMPAVRGAYAGLPAAAAMCALTLRYIREHAELLQRLRANIKYMKDGLRRLGLPMNETIAPVASFALEGRSMRRLQEQLFAVGIYVFHSTYIGAGSDGVIRCGIFADHTQQHIDALLAALRRLL